MTLKSDIIGLLPNVSSIQELCESLGLNKEQRNYATKLASVWRKDNPDIPYFNRASFKKTKSAEPVTTQSGQTRAASRKLVSRRCAQGESLRGIFLNPGKIDLDPLEVIEVYNHVRPFRDDEGLLALIKEKGDLPLDVHSMSEAIDFLLKTIIDCRDTIRSKQITLGTKDARILELEAFGRTSQVESTRLREVNESMAIQLKSIKNAGKSFARLLEKYGQNKLAKFLAILEHGDIEYERKINHLEALMVAKRTKTVFHEQNRLYRIFARSVRMVYERHEFLLRLEMKKLGRKAIEIELTKDPQFIAELLEIALLRTEPEFRFEAAKRIPKFVWDEWNEAVRVGQEKLDQECFAEVKTMLNDHSDFARASLEKRIEAIKEKNEIFSRSLRSFGLTKGVQKSNT